MNLHLWWTASFRFFWAITETCCPLSGILFEFLPHGFLTMLQMSLTFFLVSTYSLSGLSRPCSLISNQDTLGLNTSHKYIFWSQEAIIPGPCAACICQIWSCIWQHMVYCLCVSWWGSSFFAYSASEYAFSSSWATGSLIDSGSYGNISIALALLCHMVVIMLPGILSWS